MIKIANLKLLKELNIKSLCLKAGLSYRKISAKIKRNEKNLKNSELTVTEAEKIEAVLEGIYKIKVTQ